jgi:hypothetical protein
MISKENNKVNVSLYKYKKHIKCLVSSSPFIQKASENAILRNSALISFIGSKRTKIGEFRQFLEHLKTQYNAKDSF